MMEFHELLNDEDFARTLNIKMGVMIRNIKKQNELSKMSDDEILNKAIIKLVKISGERNILKQHIDKGDEKAARKRLKNIINTTGYSSYISFGKFGKRIEVKSIDGRKFNPTEKEMIDRYIEMMMPKENEQIPLF